METLKIRSIVKDAAYIKVIATRADGFIYHLESGAILGKTPSDVLEFLKNPLNEQTLIDIQSKVEKTWQK